MLDIFAFVMLAVGLSMIIGALYYRSRSLKKFNAYLENLQEEVAITTSMAPSQEVSELHFRDINGELCRIRIVIDHNFVYDPDDEKVNFITIGNGKVEEVIFSPSAVQHMRSQGMEPDEVVTKILRASGRIN